MLKTVYICDINSNTHLNPYLVGLSLKDGINVFLGYGMCILTLRFCYYHAKAITIYLYYDYVSKTI